MTGIEIRDAMIAGALEEWLSRAEAKLVDHPREHVTALVDSALEAVGDASFGPAAADAIVARRTWQAVSKLLPIAAERLRLIAGSGCEAAAQRSYLRGQYDLLASELWVALGLPVPSEFMSSGGEVKTMTEPQEPVTDGDAAEATANDAQAGTDAAADDTAEAAE